MFWKQVKGKMRERWVRVCCIPALMGVRRGNAIPVTGRSSGFVSHVPHSLFLKLFHSLNMKLGKSARPGAGAVGMNTLSPHGSELTFCSMVVPMFLIRFPN